MSFPDWFRRAQQAPLSPRLRSLLEKVVAYLKSKGADEEIVPKFVARAIDESEVSVITALRFLEQAGVTKQWYALFCKSTDVPLGKFPTLQQIPADVPCGVCDEEHCLREGACKVEIIYTFDPKKLDTFDVRASAA